MRFGSRLALILILLIPLSFAWSLPSVDAQPALLIGKTWGGPQADQANDIALDSQGNIYITGDTLSFGGGSPASRDAIILKFGPSGKLLWQRIWGGSNASDIGNGIDVDPSGNIYVTGVTQSYGSGGSDAFILKIDPSGSLLWQKTWGRAGNETGTGVVVDQSGNAYVAARTDSVGAGLLDVALLKFDPSGALLWQETWGGLDSDLADSIAIDWSAGSIYVAGHTSSFGAGGSDVLLLKFDSSGTLLWQKTWGSTGLEVTTGVAVDPSSEAVYVAGTTDSFGAGSNDIFLLKFDPTSGLLWQRTWGGSGEDYAGGVAVDPSSGDIYVTGSPSNAKVLLLHFNSAGGLVSVRNWGGTSGNFGTGVVVDSFGDVHVTGYVCCEAGPYLLSSSGNTTLGTPNFTTMLPTYAVRVATITLGSPPGSLSTPLGSETYAGSKEVFLFKYGLIPAIRFKTGSSGGNIGFNGTVYSNGQSANFRYGSATATANPPEGYMFSGWSVTGGLTVSNLTSNPTTVTVAGPGELTANFTPIPPTIFGLNPLLFYGLLGGLIAAVALIAFSVFRWRRLAPPTPQSSQPPQ